MLPRLTNNKDRTLTEDLFNLISKVNNEHLIRNS